MMDFNIIDYYIINCTIPSIITIENCYQIDFGKPGYRIRHFRYMCIMGMNWRYVHEEKVDKQKSIKKVLWLVKKFKK
mgnify:CR=1 FL=1